MGNKKKSTTCPDHIEQGSSKKAGDLDRYFREKLYWTGTQRTPIKQLYRNLRDNEDDPLPDPKGPRPDSPHKNRIQEQEESFQHLNQCCIIPGLNPQTGNFQTQSANWTFIT
ncbi:Hypothetical predicted protein [Pelobates cultripes]|uniref:Uncharacterized protein n=1 Tax=Pelobates cultripes TaxID=61616 RepID=A0AAD1W587_PELCU|nr:Hypothetical predicted protein [Pelobates cultripes]